MLIPQIESVYLPHEYKSDYIDLGNHKSKPRFGPLLGMNVLVGPNNSGKSRLLRYLFNSINEQVVPSPAIPEWLEARRTIIDLHKIIEKLRTDNTFMSISYQGTRMSDALLSWDKFVNYINIIRSNDWRRSSEFINRLDTLQQVINSINIIKNLMQKYIEIDTKNQHHESIIDIYNGIKLVHQHLSGSAPEGWPNRFHSVYIPQLRAIRAVGHDPTSLPKFAHAQGLMAAEEWQIQNSCGILTGQSVYSQVRSLLLGTLENRESMKQFEHFIGTAFFDSRPVTLIPRENSSLHIKIGSERERAVNALGDGIQQIILLTMPLFFLRDHHLQLFIDEPELHLHAGLQRLFIEKALGSIEGTGSRQIYVTTHSSHFLELTLDYKDIAVFHLNKTLPDTEAAEKDPTFSVRRVSSPDRRILVDLGVRNASVLLTNCTIWVEGITDRMYFRRYLELYQAADPKRRRYQEDLHYSFVEYSGSNITHWSFLDEADGMNAERLCGVMFLIADQDMGRDKRHEKLARALKERYCKLPCREVENLLQPKVLAAVVRHDVERIPLNAQPDSAAYSQERLGLFIDRWVRDTMVPPPTDTDHVKTFAAESGTVKGKLPFAELAIETMKDWSDVSHEAQAIVERIYQFIEGHNK